ncbi:MAG TPA: hypothetical protein VF449_08430 [Parvibaculum sp.]
MPPRPETPEASNVYRIRPRRGRRFARSIARLAGARPLRSRWRRYALLKVSFAVFAVVLLAGVAALFDRAAPQAAPDTPAYALIASAQPSPPPAAASDAQVRQVAALNNDKLLADLTAANEAGLVALQGYILTGSDGFRTEWENAVAKFEATRSAVVRDSRSWTDGGQLVELASLQKNADTLIASERLLASLVGTPNRLPGLRLYTEDVDPAFGQALALIDATLQSILASNRPDAAASVDALAHVRGDINMVRLDVASYLPSTEAALPDELKASYAAFEAAPSVIAQLRGKVGPQDQARLDRLAVLLQHSDGQIRQILLLKQTPRWDYADYVFKDKVRPLAEKITSVVAAWRAAS